MQFNPAAFNALLGNLGEYFLWRQSSACPCLDRDSGAPKASCPVCGGKGRVWAVPVQALAGVASSSNQQSWAKMGVWQEGDLVLSIPENSPLYEVSQFDRVTALTSTDDFSLVFERGAPTELVNGAVQGLKRCARINGDVLEPLPLPTVAADGSISWPDGNGPAGGTTYSLTGTRLNDYFCYGPFSSDRMKHAGMRLPRKMVMRKFDLFGRGAP